MLPSVFYDARRPNWYELGPDLSSGIQTLATEALKLAHDPSTPRHVAVAGYVLSSVLLDALPDWPEQGIPGDYYGRIEHHLFPAVRHVVEAIADEGDEATIQETTYALIAAHKACTCTG